MMTSRDFAYWLQGKFELDAAGAQPPKYIDDSQIKCIKEHLNIILMPDGFVTGVSTIIEMYEALKKNSSLSRQELDETLVKFLRNKLDEYFTKITSPLTIPYPHTWGDGIMVTEPLGLPHLDVQASC